MVRSEAGLGQDFTTQPAATVYPGLRQVERRRLEKVRRWGTRLWRGVDAADRRLTNLSASARAPTPRAC